MSSRLTATWDFIRSHKYFTSKHRTTTFLTLKYILLVVIVLSILMLLIFFGRILNYDFQVEVKRHPNINVTKLRTGLIMLLVVLIALNVLGLIGIIKENFYLMLLYSGLLTLTVFAQKDNLVQLIIIVLITIASFTFTAMIRKADLKLKAQNNEAANTNAAANSVA